MTNVLLTGGGFANKGAEALLKTVRDELGKRLVSAEFRTIVPADDSGDARKAGFVPFNSRTRHEFVAYHLGRIRTLRSARAWAATNQADRQLGWIKDCAAVLDVSGYAYADRFGSYPLQLTERLVSGCLAASVPYVFMPQAWGPLTEPFSLRAIRNVAEHSALIHARDKTSLKCLQSVPDIPLEKLHLAPDIVLRFEPRKNAETLEPLERTRLLSKERPRMGICPNIRIYSATERDGTGMGNPYVRWLAELCRTFLKETEAELVLFPHEMSLNWWRRDDRYVCRLVHKAIADNRRVRYFSEYCPVDSLKLLAGRLDFLVSSRFHSIIAALSLHVPTVAVGWSHKYHELLSDAGVGELAFSYERMDDGAIRRILEAWASRDRVRHRLLRSIPILQENVDKVFDRVAGVLRRSKCC